MRPPWPAAATPLTKPRFEIQQLRTLMTARVQPALSVLLAAVVLVLLIVCANVANLLLARGTARQREIAARVAIGATGRRIVRLVMMESVVLAVGAGIVGAAFAAGGLRLVQRLSEIESPGIFRLMLGSTLLPRSHELVIDGRVFATAVAIAALASLFFGLLPALRLSRLDRLHALAARGSDTAHGASRARDTLVVAQLALATVLLVGSALLTGSFMRLASFDKGYDPSNVVALNLLFPDSYSTATKAARIQTLLERFRGIPSVQSAGFARHGLLIGEELFLGNWVPQGRSLEEMKNERIRVRAVSDGFLTAMGAHVIEGRDLAPADAAAPMPTIVMSRASAQRFFGSTSAIGRVLEWYLGSAQTQVRVVGVVDDLRQESATDEIFPEIFVDYRHLMTMHASGGDNDQRQNERAIGFLSFALRTNGAPESLIPAARKVVAGVVPNIGIDAIVPMNQLEASAIARDRFYAIALSLVAALPRCWR